MPRPCRVPTSNPWETEYRSAYTWKSPVPPPPELGIPEWSYRAPHTLGVETRQDEIQVGEEDEEKEEEEEEEMQRLLGGMALSLVGNKNISVLCVQDGDQLPEAQPVVQTFL